MAGVRAAGGFAERALSKPLSTREQCMARQASAGVMCGGTAESPKSQYDLPKVPSRRGAIGHRGRSAFDSKQCKQMNLERLLKQRR